MVAVPLVFFIIAGSFFSWKTWQLWYDERQVDFFKVAFGFMPFGDRFKRGEIRAAVPTVIALWLIVVLLAALVAEDLLGWSVSREALLTTVGLLLSTIPLELAVILVNRPKFLVPPHMRGDDGLLIDAWNRRKRKTALSDGGDGLVAELPGKVCGPGEHLP